MGRDAWDAPNPRVHSRGEKPIRIGRKRREIFTRTDIASPRFLPPILAVHRPPPSPQFFRAIRTLCLSLLLLQIARVEGAEPTATLAGTWHFDPTRSTELSPWKNYELVITVRDSVVSFDRKLAWGRREYADRMVLDLSKPESVVPIDYWPDNRHLGAYIGDQKTKTVRAAWLDGARILRLSSDLVLETQQGPRAVNILSDYKVSANGALLTLTELRSTRNRPIVYVFTRQP